jgi:EmrB/QacA subfamily drug resistance transporter
MSFQSAVETRGPSREAAEAAMFELNWIGRYTVLGIVCVGVFMNTLDTGITDILNPVFVTQFHLDLYSEYWIELSYAIPLIGMLLPAGYLGDSLGRKNVFLTGMIMFGAGSGLVTLMPTFETMFIARVIEGIGAAFISANGGVLAVSVFPWKQRGQVLGIIGTAVALGLKFGPVVGGFFNDNFGWRSAFLVNPALGIIFVLVGSMIVPATRRGTGRGFDVWGALLFIVSIGCLLVVVNQAPTLGLTSPSILFCIVGFVVFGAAFFYVSTHVKNPCIDLSLYKTRNFTVSVTCAFFSFLALAPINHLMPFYMDNVQGLHVAETSLIFISTTIAIAVTQPFSGRLADRIGSRSVASVGLLVQGIGLISLAFIPLVINPDWLVPQLALIGVGVGLFRSPNHRALFGSVPRDKMGQAGGYQHLPRQLGESIGETGVVTAFTAVVLASAASMGIQPPAAALAAAARPTVVPTATPAPQRLSGIQAYVPAGVAQSVPAGQGGAQPVPVGQGGAQAVPVGQAAASQPAAAGAGASLASTGAGGTLLSATATDDQVIDVPDAGESQDISELNPAITSLPPDVQMLGYRIMWGVAGLMALGAAGFSWFGRNVDEYEFAGPVPASAPAPQRRVPVVAGADH